MSNEQARQFVEQATQSVQAGQFGHGLELAEQAIALDESLAEAHVVRAVSLSQLSRPQEANEAFARAISLDPLSSKAHYNFAFHLYSHGDRTQALQHAEEAVRVDPSNQAARELASRISHETGLPMSAAAEIREMAPSADEPVAASAAPSVGPGTAGYSRGSEVVSAHALPWVERIGPTWTAIGWGIAGLSLLCFIWTVLVALPTFGDAGGDIQAFQKLLAERIPKLLTVLGWTANLGVLTFTIFDLVDRRGSFLWIIPQLLCGCCVGFGFITMPIYLLAGRK